MNSPKNLGKGQSQYESYKSPVARKVVTQYDYRHTDGDLFSCVKKTLAECIEAKDEWLKNKNIKRMEVVGYKDDGDFYTCAGCNHIIESDEFICPSCYAAIDWNKEIM